MFNQMYGDIGTRDYLPYKCSSTLAEGFCPFAYKGIEEIIKKFDKEQINKLSTKERKEFFNGIKIDLDRKRIGLACSRELFLRIGIKDHNTNRKPVFRPVEDYFNVVLQKIAESS